MYEPGKPGLLNVKGKHSEITFILIQREKNKFFEVLSEIFFFFLNQALEKYCSEECKTLHFFKFAAEVSIKLYDTDLMLLVLFLLYSLM